MKQKTIWQSKTFWVNIIAMVALIVQSKMGYIINPETQAGILGIINVILRFVTNQSVSWSNEDNSGG